MREAAIRCRRHSRCIRVHRDGVISYVREDIGRHNALDKSLGPLARGGVAVADGAPVITNRASFEMVQKVAALSVGTLAAVSAPTAAAVRLAKKLNLTLIGFLRQQTCVTYSRCSMTEDLKA